MAGNRNTSLRVQRNMARALLALLAVLAFAPAARAEDSKPTLTVDRVVAVVNDEIVLSSELMMRVAPLAFDLSKISDPKERARKQSKLANDVLSEMINEVLVSQAAETAQLDVSAKEVEAAIADLKKQNNLDDEGLAKALKMQGLSMSSYRKDVRQQILRMRAVNTLVRPRVTITEDDVKARYDDGQRRSGEVSAVRLKHILIAVPPTASTDEKQALRAKATEILEKAKAGESFDALAAQHSEDPATRNTGGDMGWIKRNTIDSEWETIVFAMDKGETRGPIAGPHGLHIFQVVDVQDSQQKPFDEVKEKLRNELYRERMDKETRIWLDELRKKAHFEIML